MDNIFQELNWTQNFAHTGSTINKWCNEEKGNPRYFQIPIERLCDNFEVYKNLRDKLQQHGLILYKSKFMQVLPKDFTGIHVDQSVARPDLPEGAIHYYDASTAMDYATVAKPVVVALNIPLLNGDDHITRWYSPKECDVSLRVAPCGPLPSIDPARFPSKDALVSDLCVASFRMSKPSLIRTDILHNVDARHSLKRRWIMSFRINDVNTKTFITWDDLPRIHAIQF
jgi:hypothetical protein